MHGDMGLTSRSNLRYTFDIFPLPHVSTLHTESYVALNTRDSSSAAMSSLRVLMSDSYFAMNGVVLPCSLATLLSDCGLASLSLSEIQPSR